MYLNETMKGDYVMRLKKCALGLLLLILTNFNISTVLAEPLSADLFVPKPNLRISMKGILGSDGTTFAGSLITVKLENDTLTTEAQEELNYFEGTGQTPFDASARRTVFRYVSEDAGISRVPVVAPERQKKEFWLPRKVDVGVQWKSPYGRRSEIMEKNVSVETPAGRFDGCILLEEDGYAAATAIMKHYLAPGVGLVKSFAQKGAVDSPARIWYEVQRVENIDRQDALKIVKMLTRTKR